MAAGKSADIDESNATEQTPKNRTVIGIPRSPAHHTPSLKKLKAQFEDGTLS